MKEKKFEKVVEYEKDHFGLVGGFLVMVFITFVSIMMLLEEVSFSSIVANLLSGGIIAIWFYFFIDLTSSRKVYWREIK